MQVKDLDNKPQGIRLQDLNVREYFVPISNKDNTIYVLLEKVTNNTLPHDIEIGVCEEDGVYIESLPFTKDSLVERVYIKKIEFTRKKVKNYA